MRIAVILMMLLTVFQPAPVCGSQQLKDRFSEIRAYLEAVRAADFGLIKDMLQKNRDLLELKGEKDRTALYMAVEKSNKPLVEWLLAAGADVNAPDMYGITPFMASISAMRDYTVQESHPDSADCFRLLLENGGEIKSATNIGLTPLHFAVALDDTGPAGELLNRGADVNASSSSARTPLLWMADHYGRNLAMARLLIERGADINAVDKDGWTSLHHAAENENPALATLLLEKKARYNIEDLKGRLPLHIAAFRQSFRTAELLLAAGTDVNARDKSGKSPLLSCTGDGSLKLMKLLLDNGADINLRGEYGYTALHYAAVNNRAAIARMLVENGALLMKNNSGKTPLDYAKKNKNKELTSILRKAKKG